MSSPPPVYNFRTLPTVHGRDALWTHKVASIGPDVSAHGHHGIHLPQPSYFPALCALGIMLLAYGVLFSTSLAIVGLLLAIVSIYAWAFEGVGNVLVLPEPEEELV